MEGGRIVQSGEPEDIVLSPANDYVADFVAHMNPLNVLTRRLADDPGGSDRAPRRSRSCSIATSASC